MNRNPLLGELEGDAHRAAHAVGALFHPHPSAAAAAAAQPKEITMTTTTDAGVAAAEAATSGSFWTDLHHNITVFTGIMGRFLPHLEQIAANPKLDAAVEALLTAAGAGVEAEVFVFVTNALNSAAAAKTAPAPGDGQPA